MAEETEPRKVKHCPICNGVSWELSPDGPVLWVCSECAWEREPEYDAPSARTE